MQQKRPQTNLDTMVRMWSFLLCNVKNSLSYHNKARITAKPNIQQEANDNHDAYALRTVRLDMHHEIACMK